MNYITTESLGEPYDLLADFLSISEIDGIHKKFCNKTLYFREDRENDDKFAVITEAIVGDRKDYENSNVTDKAKRVLEIFAGKHIYFPPIDKAISGGNEDSDEINRRFRAELTRRYGC